MSENKQYEIPKSLVIGVYKKVKANKGSAGIDGVDFEFFEEYIAGQRKKQYTLSVEMEKSDTTLLLR